MPIQGTSWLRTVTNRLLLVQHLVVLEVVQHGVGHRAGLGGEEHRRALDPRWRTDEHGFQKTGQIDRVGAQFFVEQAPALLPGHHEREDGGADDQREPAAFKQLQEVGGKERKVHDKEHPVDARHSASG